MYEVIIVGGGHAGIEAALATSRMNLKTALVTTSEKYIGTMPCNPSIGGPAKGIVVREIDALGGQMGKTTDKTYLQMKMLNTNKGPAVWSLRAQADLIEYPRMMREVIANQENLTVIENQVSGLIIEDDKVAGVTLANNEQIKAKTVVVTTGTHMSSKILLGHVTKEEGPDGEPTSKNLSNQLSELGFELMRLKTGTPARIKKSSIDFSKVSVEAGTDAKLSFSYTTNEYVPFEKQEPCYLTYTTEETHEIIRENLHLSSMYSGHVKGAGPRYCPSIEDKVVRFSDKPRHQIFLEPETESTDQIYVQGLSNSFPNEIQEKLLRSVIGLENAEIYKYAYAIEYDAINPTQLYPTLESKLVQGLYFAGQINGTSGYEEAAGQGLLAGINAGLKIKEQDPLILTRDQAYIGVLIDDLVTKGTKEPYRLLTSRAEYRLLLRHDNADERLTSLGKKVGLVTDDDYELFRKRLTIINQTIDQLKEIRLTPKTEINDYLNSINSSSLKDGISAYELLKRPEIKLEHIEHLTSKFNIDDNIKTRVEINITYEGYIKKALEQARRMQKMEELKIPDTINYDDVKNLASEARLKLEQIRPKTIGQASRISGVNPADISLLIVYLKAKQ